jgi:serine/threonine-protein kinase
MDARNDARELSIGTVLGGRYEIADRIAAGGMGVVYRARHLELGQLVAIKVLTPSNEAAHARFAREAKLAAKLRGEHVARIIDFSRDERDAPFLVMEYLEGSDLSTLVKQSGALPVEKAIDLVLQALIGVGEAHAIGIVHRDLKPSNLFLARAPDGFERVKVMDFGIAKSVIVSAEEDSHVTASAVVMGTVAYASPEVLRSARKADVRSDIWSLGATLYRLLTARLPFEAASPLDVAAEILDGAPTALRTYRPDLPAGLERVVLRCLANEPSRRPQNVADLAASLAPFGGASAMVFAARVANALGMNAIPALSMDSSAEEVGDSPTSDPRSQVHTLTLSESRAGTPSAGPQTRTRFGFGASIAAVGAALLCILFFSVRACGSSPEAVVPATSRVPPITATTAAPSPTIVETTPPEPTTPPSATTTSASAAPARPPPRPKQRPTGRDFGATF